MKIDRRRGRGYFKDWFLMILLILAALTALALVLTTGCEPRVSEVREYLAETGEMPLKKDIEESFRIEEGAEKIRYCDSCCARSLPGYKVCRRCLDRNMEGGTNGRDN